jgi:hypothetical protein
VRRAQLLDRVTAARQCLLDPLDCAWPSVLGAAEQPAESLIWRAALTVSASPRVIAAMSPEEFTAAVRGQLLAAGGKRISQRIAAAIHAAPAASKPSKTSGPSGPASPAPTGWRRWPNCAGWKLEWCRSSTSCT